VISDALAILFVLLTQVRSIWKTLHSDAQWKGVKVGIASRCDEPDWARELLNIIEISPKVMMKDVVSYTQIHKV
jgi:hypothetical protein